MGPASSRTSFHSRGNASVGAGGTGVAVSGVEGLLVGERCPAIELVVEHADGHGAVAILEGCLLEVAALGLVDAVESIERLAGVAARGVSVEDAGERNAELSEAPLRADGPLRGEYQHRPGRRGRAKDDAVQANGHQSGVDFFGRNSLDDGRRAGLGGVGRGLDVLRLRGNGGLRLRSGCGGRWDSRGWRGCCGLDSWCPLPSQLVMFALRDNAVLQENVGELLISGLGGACVLNAGYIGRVENALGFE